MNLRPSGIDVVGGTSWGTHFCQFYRDQSDLTDALVPYFKAGLEAGECCMWVIAPPLDSEAARRALAQAFPDLERHFRDGQLQILSHADWYLSKGEIQPQRILERWLRKLAAAQAQGFVGLRVSGDTSWLEQSAWQRFSEYESALDSMLGQNAMLALCTYSLSHGTVEVAEVINQHQFALFRRDNAWELIEGVERQRLREEQIRAISLERERLSVTLHSIGDAVVVTDNSSSVVMLNRAAEQLCGWSQREAIGRPVTEILRFVDEQLSQPNQGLGALSLRETTREDGSALLIDRDGTSHPVSANASSIRGSDGLVMGTVLVLRNVEHSRRTERLEQGLRRFELLAETAGELLHAREPKQPAYSLCARVMTHLDCQVFFNFLVDESTGRLHLHACAGISEQEARELEWLECGSAICGCVAMERTRIVADHILEGQDPRADLVRAQGVRAYACHPLLGPGGRVLGTLSFGTKTRDTFDDDELSLMKAVADQVAIAMVRQQDEASLRKSEEALREADRRKNDFLAVLSHELRNPLAPIMNGLHVLDQVAPGSEQARRAQRVIRRQVVQLARLVDDLLDVTRITRNRVALQRQVLELNQLLRRAVEDQRGLFEESGLELELELPDCCIFVEADATRITQIVSNLLQNAARFSRVGGHTTVSLLAKEPDQVVEIRVADDGVGIADDIRPYLFQPFMQADSTLDRRKGGLGLGLSLVKGLVELHGGEITVYSAGVDSGSVFTVRLPLRSMTWESGSRSSSSIPAARCVPRRVLVIEDNEDAADTLREALEFSENQVEVAYNGPDGIQKARVFLPDVILCDIGLPGMTGYEVAVALRRDDRFQNAHLVALTGYALPEDRRRAEEAGFDDHLPKPSSVQAIQNLLSKLSAPRSA